MLFWGLIGLTLVIGLTITILVSKADGEFALGSFLLTLLSTSVIVPFFGGIALSIVASGQARTFSYTETHQLRALNNGSQTSGSFFLGIGSFDEKRVVNYIPIDADGGMTLKQIGTYGLKIYEKDNVKPSVSIDHFNLNTGWLVPWTMNTENGPVFTVPTGSVLENYTIDNTK